MSKNVFFIILVSVLSHAAHADLYQWKDENGKLHFSDRASNEQAKTVTVTRPNSYSGADSKAVHDKARQSTRQPEKRSRFAVPPYQQAPQNQVSQQEIQERVADCERRRIVGCGDARARREIADEAYRNTPGGRRQQEQIRDRKMREWMQQR
ncbi:DUF4124 domain-containing protein [Alcanivorax sp.]|uniref:DUF4124 domain-containing protein n=1 Tax=Alcanivorax sp. TaxID=1872427 RepID=UPI0025C64832|nr:DUF4124 domain-containing protein [Alcanivorax sp.]